MGSLHPRCRQLYSEMRLARFRFNANLSAMFPDNTNNGIETESGAFTYGFGRKKRFKNPLLNLCWNPRTGVFDVYSRPQAVPSRGYPQAPAVLHRVGGIVDEVGPDLIQLAAERTDFGQRAVIIPNY